MKTRAIVIAVVLLLGAGAWAGYSFLFKVAAATDSLLVSGNIEAHESVVSFKGVQSRVVALPFDEGQWVTAGTLLAQLDDSDYRQQVAINEAALHVQEQELASAMEKLAAARATVANDNADLAQKNIDYGRSQKLWIDKIISGDQRDHTETALKQSSAGMQRDVAMERSAQQDIEVAKANIRNASANLELAKIMLGYTTLRAPFSGVILTRQTELGEVMQPGTPVVTLADLDHVWLRAYVAETDLGRIRWGQAATVHTDTYPDKSYPGKISFISSEAEFTPKSVETHKERVTLVYRIKIDVENSSHELKPGMPADATIHLGPPVQEGHQPWMTRQ
jgi:HlyD family secretion protein